MNTGPTSAEIAAYNNCFNAKHHYDNLSWTILGLAMAFSGVIAAFLPTIDVGSYWGTVGTRACPAAFGCIALQAWRQIYERNRFWAEVANETAREFERRFNVSGVAIAFMRGSISKEIHLSNLDLQDVSVAPPHVEKCKQGSIHFRVPLIAHACTAVLVLECFIQK